VERPAPRNGRQGASCGYSDNSADHADPTVAVYVGRD
jgi:hypothetical protein